MRLARFLADKLGLRDEAAAIDRLVSRRKWLLGGTLAAALLNTEEKAEAAPSADNLRFLVDRLTFGWTQEEQNLADSLDYNLYLERQLNYTQIDDSAMTQRLSSYEALDFLPMQMHFLINVSYGYEQLYEAAVLRAAYSKRQLFERMVEFWTDHFNINIFSGECAWIKNWDDKNVIRKHAMGRFRDLLGASAHSACMLHYLNNEFSVAAHPNENYARELMELHTLGVDGGYTQQDVIEVARCFTGWDFYRYNIDGANRQMFRFTSAVHDFNQKVVLGNVIPAGGGESDGNTVLDILAAHPNTARFIATKLCKRFWSESPPQSLIDAVTATYLSTDGDIKAMLRTLFTTLDPSTAGPKFKRPFHLFVSALRATNATYATTGQQTSPGMRDALSFAGHLMFNWAPPDGYPDRADAWVGLPLARWNFGASLMNGNIHYVSVDIDQFFAGTSTADQMINRINARLFGGRLPAADQILIRDYLATNPSSAPIRREALGLAMAAPAFQWY